MAKISERGTSAVSTTANKKVVNVLHQRNRVATMSGGTTLSPSSSVSANHVIHGNFLSGSGPPILSQEGLSTLLRSYICNQLLLVSKSNQLSDTTAAVTQSCLCLVRQAPCYKQVLTIQLLPVVSANLVPQAVK